jgi:hypothetical protein
MRALPIALPPKLRVTAAEASTTPFYLRTLFRLLSSWVHQTDAPALLPAQISSTLAQELSQP